MFDKLNSMSGAIPRTVTGNILKPLDRKTTERQGLDQDPAAVVAGQTAAALAETLTTQSTTRVQPTQETLEQQRIAEHKPDVNQQPADNDEAASELTEAVAGLNNAVTSMNLSVQFNVHEEYDELVVQVYDKESDEMIRQIPPEEALAIASFFNDLQAAREEQGAASQGQNSDKKNNTDKLEGILLNTQV